MRAERKTPLLWRYGHTGADASRTFVLLPFAGGSAYAFSPWLKHLLAPSEVALAVQYPGRGPRIDEPGPRSLGELADQTAYDLCQHAPGPLVMVGHSLGGVLAYEVAARLERAGRGVELVAVSAARPPSLTDLDPARIEQKTDREWIDELREDGFLDEDSLAYPDLIALAIRALRSDCLLLARHPASEQRLRAPILTLGGERDPGIEPGHLAAWANLTREPLLAASFPGGHFYYRDQLSTVCARIRAALPRRVAA